MIADACDAAEAAAAVELIEEGGKTVSVGGLFGRSFDEAEQNCHQCTPAVRSSTRQRVATATNGENAGTRRDRGHVDRHQRIRSTLRRRTTAGGQQSNH